MNKTLTKTADGTIVMSDSPKTKAGNRILPIPKVLEPFIIEQLQISKDVPNNSENLLFKPPIVQYARVSTLNWSLNKILKELDIPHFSTNSLRHTYTTQSI